MDEPKEQKEKLQALNMLGARLQIQKEGIKLTGEAFYLGDRAVILKKDKEYIFINVSKFEELKIHCDNHKSADCIKEQLAQQSARPSDVLSFVLD